MSFALPIAFVLVGLALPIIGFYILKVRLRRVPSSTNLFWKQIFEEKPPRSIWQNFRHLLSLLLQLLMLLLLVLAIADPYFPGQMLQSRRVVIVMDHSASMRASDVKPSRFEAARQATRDLMKNLRFRDEAAIVLAGHHPTVIVGMTNHLPTLQRAIDSLEVSDAPTDLKEAVELGKQMIGKHPRGEVIVFTDGCVVPQDVEPMVAESEVTPTVPEPNVNKDPSKLQVVYRLFGSDVSNIGITQFQVRRSLSDPIGYEVLALVHNASDKPAKCRLELSLDDIPIDILPLELKPDETWSRSIEKTSLNGGELVAELTQVESVEPGVEAEVTNINQLATDDRAWALLPPRQIQKVFILSPGNLFLQKVFEANPLVKVEVAKEMPSQWPTDTIIVLHGQVPSQLPEGNLFVIDPSDACDQWEVGSVLENPIVTDQDKASPLMTHIRLDNVLMPEAKQLKFKVAPHVLAGTVTGDPVYAEVKRDVGKCLVLSVNLERSDLAFRTAFPIMVTNSLGWFAGQSGELRESTATGSVSNVDFAVTPDIRSDAFAILSPSSQKSQFIANRVNHHVPSMKLVADRAQETSSRSEAAEAMSGRIGPLNEVGIWRIKPQVEVDSKNPSETEVASLFDIAVNLASLRETDLRPAKELLESVKTQTKLTGWLGRPFWYYLVVAACLLAAGEWFLYQRRVIT
jgi:von Willebrand factor type A domain/Aerotolerance regulator N-terminal